MLEAAISYTEENLRDEVLNERKLAVRLVRDQMWHGQINPVRPRQKLYYTKFTIGLKKRFARFPKTDYITLKWDGDFHDSIFLNNRRQLDSNNPTWLNKLRHQERFENALGLTEQSKLVLGRAVNVRARTAILAKVRQAA